MPKIVFVSLFDHGHQNNKQQRHGPTRRRDRRIRQNQHEKHRAQEVDIGSFPELLKQIQRDEGKNGVLGSVCPIAPELGLQGGRASTGLDHGDLFLGLRIRTQGNESSNKGGIGSPLKLRGESPGRKLKCRTTQRAFEVILRQPGESLTEIEPRDLLLDLGGERGDPGHARLRPVVTIGWFHKAALV